MAAWSDDRIVTFDLQGQRFRTLVDQPHDGNPDHAVVVLGEYGNGAGESISLGAVTRARIVRDMVDPRASLVYQPNATFMRPGNMNFSGDERSKLKGGSLSPLLGRLAVVLKDHLSDPEALTLYGPSQGAVVALGYAAHPDTPERSAVAVVEAPNVIDRSSIQLAKAFMASGGQLKEHVLENFADPDAPFARDVMKTISAISMGRALLGFARGDNLAMAGILRRNSAEDQIAAILERNGSVVQAHGTASYVSPAEANVRLGKIFANDPHYRRAQLEGSDHSVTNNYVLNGALTRIARQALETE